MVKKTYVLDTNVLLVDPNAIYAYKENDIVLPFIVLEELDRHKNTQDEVGANARAISRKLHELVKSNQTLEKGICINGKGKIRVVSSKEFLTDLTGDTDSKKADNHILAVCVGLSKKTPSKKITLVTNDVLLRIKANAYGVKTEQYDKYKNAQSTNKLSDTSGSKAYTGVREVLVTPEVLSQFWENKKDREYLAYAIEKSVGPCKPNEFIKISDGSSGEPFVVRYMVHEARYVPDYFEIQKIKPRNSEQRLALDLLLDTSVSLVTCVGFAGTGKTLLAIGAGLEQVVDKRKYETLIVCRPVQPLGKDIGYLPGTVEEKLEPWIAPIKDNLRFLLSSSGGGRKNKNSESTLNYYFDRGIIEVEAMAYIRGRSISNAYMIIDEAQNLSMHELKTIITRAGEGTKIVLTGDIEQIDNQSVDLISNGLSVAVEKFKEHEIAGHITLLSGERSELASLAASIL